MMEHSNQPSHYYNSYQTDRHYPQVHALQEYEDYTQQGGLMKRKPKRPMRPNFPPPEANPLRRHKPAHNSFPPNKDDFEVKNILGMISSTGKNYIALLHEYSKKSNKAVTYKYDIKKDRSRYPSKDIYVCTIIIESHGLLSRGEGFNKKDAKNTAGEYAIYNLIKFDPRARRIVNDLLIKQSSPEKSGLNKASPFMRNVSTGGYSQQTWPRANQTQTTDSTSVYEVLHNDENMYAKLQGFATTFGKSIRWTLKSEENQFVVECILGEARTVGQSIKKKSARHQAACHMLRLIDDDQSLKQKFIIYLQNDHLGNKENRGRGPEFREAQTHFENIREVKKTIANIIDFTLSEESKANREVKEPDELIFRLISIDKHYSLSDEEGTHLKEFFELFNELMSMAFQSSSYQLIPVGSHVIGCVTNYNMVVDCYVYFEKREEVMDESVNLQTVKAHLLPILKNNPRFNKINYSVEELTPESLLIKDGLSKSAVRLIWVNYEDAQDETKVNRCTAGINHSNWLIESYNQSNTAWQAIKLFRLIRIWKDAKKFSFMPTEILDLTLNYATFSFKETGIFKVLLKFFTLLTLMLSSHNESFFELSEFHVFLIDSLNEEQKTTLIEYSQKTYLNLVQGSIEDFEFR